MPAVVPGHHREDLESPARVGRVHRYLGQRRQFAGVVMPRRDRVVAHPVVQAQVVDAFADALGVPFFVGDLGVPGGVGHPVVHRRRLLDELLGYRSHPGHQRVAGRRPFGRAAQPGQLSLLQLPDVEHALDLRQSGLGPGRAGERLARGAVARAAVEYGAPVPRRPARRVLQQGAADSPLPRRRVHHDLQTALVQVLPGRQVQPVPAHGLALVGGQPHLPWTTVPADGHPAGERLLREPRLPGMIDALSGQHDLEARADPPGVRGREVHLLDFHPHSQPRPGSAAPPNIPPLPPLQCTLRNPRLPKLVR